MVKIPDPYSGSGPASMRGGGQLASVDSSGLERGADAIARGTGALAQGFMNLSGNLSEIDQRNQQRQNVSDIAKAEALWTKGSLELGNQFGQDGDWRTFSDRAEKQTQELKQKAGELIRDPNAREQFLADAELRRLATVDAINDHGRMLSQQEDRVSFEQALADSALLIADPNVGEATRKKAGADMLGSIEVAKNTGLITPKEAADLKATHLDTAAQQLAINRAYLAGQVDPDAVIKDLGFPAPGKTGDVSPIYASLDAKQRLSLADHMRVMASQQQQDVRATLAITEQNAPAAIMNTGSYTGGPLPDEAAYIKAYGPVEGPQRAQQFNASIEVASTAYGMRTMSNDAILSTVQSMVPKSTGDEAAVEQKRYEAVSQAADVVLKARKEDPASYVQQTFPNVQQAWQNVGNDPAKFAQAIAVTAEAEKQLGFDELVLLPKQMADKAAVTFKDPNLPQEQRVGAITGLVLSTQDEGQQRAIFDQLVKAGVPPHTEAAMDALVRGDAGAASFLFRAALTEAKDIKLNTDQYPAADINKGLAKAFAEGSVADVAYGITGGTATNFDRASQDAALMERAVKLRLLDGSATSVDQAVQLTIKDMFGDVRVVEDQNVKIMLPTEADDAPYKAGFDALLGHVGDALMQNMTPAIDGAPTNNGEAAILSTARNRYVDQVLQQGYFTNSGDGFVFIDPKTGSYVPGPDGKPLTFSRDDVLAAGAQSVSTDGYSGRYGGTIAQ